MKTITLRNKVFILLAWLLVTTWEDRIEVLYGIL